MNCPCKKCNREGKRSAWLSQAPPEPQIGVKHPEKRSWVRLLGGTTKAQPDHAGIK